MTFHAYRSLSQQMVLTLNRWIHQNKEQTEQVKLLVNTLKESEDQKEKEQKVLRQKLEDMTIQVLNLSSKFYSNTHVSFTIVDESSWIRFSQRTTKPITGWSGKGSRQTNDSQVATGELGTKKSPFSKFLFIFLWLEEKNRRIF